MKNNRAIVLKNIMDTISENLSLRNDDLHAFERQPISEHAHPETILQDTKSSLNILKLYKLEAYKGNDQLLNNDHIVNYFDREVRILEQQTNNTGLSNLMNHFRDSK